MFTRISTLVVCGALLAPVMVPSVQARHARRNTTYLTFSGPVALPGVTLAAGTYIFELAEPSASHDLVRVRDRSTVYLTAFTMRTERPAGWPADRHVSFGEMPAGTPPPILVWYPTGESWGHRFIYPADRR